MTPTPPCSRAFLLLALTLALVFASGAEARRASKTKARTPAAPAEPPPESAMPSVTEEAACVDPSGPAKVRLLVMDLKATETLAPSARSLTQVVAEQAALSDG